MKRNFKKFTNNDQVPSEGKKKVRTLQATSTEKKISTSRTSNFITFSNKKEKKTQWIQWKNNSYRIDAFMSIFTLLLYNKDDLFHNRDREGNFSITYNSLCDAADALNYGANYQAIADLWNKLIEDGVEPKLDHNRFGPPIVLFNVLEDMYDIRLSYYNEQKCRKCCYAECGSLKTEDVLIKIECGPANFLDINLEAEIDSILRDELRVCPSCDAKKALS